MVAWSVASAAMAAGLSGEVRMVPGHSKKPVGLLGSVTGWVGGTAVVGVPLASVGDNFGWFLVPMALLLGLGKSVLMSPVGLAAAQLGGQRVGGGDEAARPLRDLPIGQRTPDVK